MNSVHPFAVAVCLILTSQVAVAQDLSPASLASATKRIDLPAGALSDSAVLARWENSASSLTLVREFPGEFQLMLISKPVSARARTAIREAIRLDAIEAPGRQSARHKKEATDAGAAPSDPSLAHYPRFHE